MRIALVAGPHVPVPPVKYGGSEQVIYYLIKGLQEAGHEPILLAAGDSSVDCEVIPIVEKAIFFPPTRKDIKAFTEIEKKAVKTTERKLRELLPRIDIIHSHGFDLYNFKQYPNLTTLHNMIEFKDIEYLKKRSMLYYAPISDSQKASFPELKYVQTVYNGENPKEFPVVTNPSDYVCFLGRFDRDKNPHLAIQLAISMGVKIKLAGKIDYLAEGYFDQEVKKFFDHPLVEYLGELGFDDKVKLLSNARCNLHPTNFREPFGLTVLEAAYCGTPTLATVRGSMPELLEAGRTGVMVEDFIEGRQHLEECFKMDRQYIADRARRLFNYKTMAEHYVEAYEQIIKEMPQPRNSFNFFGQLRQLMSRSTQKI